MPSIVIVEDHEMVRDGLEALLASVPGFAVVGTASGIRAAIGILGCVTPDVLLVDLCLHDGPRRVRAGTRDARSLDGLGVLSGPL